MVKTPLACLVLLAALAGGNNTAAGSEGPAGLSVDLELVIAVDISASMDAEEYAIQRAGYADAIGHPDFIRAVLAGAYRRIALTYVEWSGARSQKVIVPWSVIDSADSARAFAAALAGKPVAAERGTSISAMLLFGAGLLATDPFQGDRKVIDISGDGPNNYGPQVTQARDRVVGEGVVINGLPILIRPSPIFPAMDRYYSECVIGGPGSFVLPVHAAAEFALAIRRKLVLEVASPPAPPASIIRVAASEPVDCLVGERMRERYSDPYLPGLDQ